MCVNRSFMWDVLIRYVRIGNKIFLNHLKTNQTFLCETLKIHVIYHHYQDLFDLKQKTMKFTNGEFTEKVQKKINSRKNTHQDKQGVKDTRKVTKVIASQNRKHFRISCTVQNDIEHKKLCFLFMYNYWSTISLSLYIWMA